MELTVWQILQLLTMINKTANPWRPKADSLPTPSLKEYIGTYEHHIHQPSDRDMTLPDESFKRLFELSGDAMMVLDQDTFTYCNPATLKIFACGSLKEFCTKHPSDLSPPIQPCGTSSLTLSLEHIEEAAKHGHTRFEWVHRRLTGEDFYADVLLSPVIWEGHTVIQAIVRDISSYKALQESLRQESALSEQANKAKSDFLAVMSHEIRTPIHGILGAQELLLNTELDDEQTTLATLANRSAKHLLQIVNNVLDYSKIDAKKLMVEETVFSVRQLLEDIRELFQVEANGKSIRLLIQSEPHDARLVGDLHLLQQILSNLIANALKFTHSGGEVRLVSALQMQPDQRHGDWSLQVIDTGIGMTEAQQNNVFEVFTQADSTTSRHYGGTGLGLAICRGLVDRMGGTISVTSQPGEGTCFDVQLTLPLASASTHTPQDLDQSFNQSSSSDALSNDQRNYQREILIAEDIPTNQYIIRKQTEQLGLTPRIVNNGEEVITAYHDSLNADGNSRYAMILMDVQMPVMSGLEATQRLRALGCTLPIVALTADVLIEQRQRCQEVGMQAFIAKPFVKAKLLEVFDQYLS
ncbi:hybrid sensor histidine kinase/response regulator [Pseudomaricurvus sp.]|uniref:hybrid sensor histidine kinase/response regulator n=1 Tax=Pseudomaricurvus sp. TaxID=2004510 RepID=UPI003F6DA3D8